MSPAHTKAAGWGHLELDALGTVAAHDICYWRLLCVCAPRGGKRLLIGSRHEDHPQRMLGRGSQPARCQVRDKKGATGVIQCCEPGNTETESKDRAFLAENGQLLKIREGGY